MLAAMPYPGYEHLVAVQYGIPDDIGASAESGCPFAEFRPRRTDAGVFSDQISGVHDDLSRVARSRRAAYNEKIV
ncbi:hypothetical protein WG70_22670 [Burkholderia oklahomensis EO147]|nr:hypothetical protein WG70_22670 [Burkholderia oklahomensis EO147]AOI45961.1 hypothetical protein WI23_09295 [Burkholderia oklahomensis C6786]KUY52679.1 hypothetical protein WG70_00245 [Burkholderia oklahomensis EO147]KUY54691.1 hypothetical protein WI23_21600 [Burkholderia oklahomensis C6786]